MFLESEKQKLKKLSLFHLFRKNLKEEIWISYSFQCTHTLP